MPHPEATRPAERPGIARTYWQPLLAAAAPPAVSEEVRQIAHAQRVEDVIRGVRAFHGRSDRSRFLAEWSGPVTVVSGEHDIAPAPSRALAGALRDGRYAVVPRVGHYVPLEGPAALRELIEDAVAEVARGTAGARRRPGVAVRA